MFSTPLLRPTAASPFRDTPNSLDEVCYFPEFAPHLDSESHLEPTPLHSDLDKDPDLPRKTNQIDRPKSAPKSPAIRLGLAYVIRYPQACHHYPVSRLRWGVTAADHLLT